MKDSTRYFLIFQLYAFVAMSLAVMEFYHVAGFIALSSLYWVLKAAQPDAQTEKVEESKE